MSNMEYDSFNAYINNLKNEKLEILSLEEEIELGKRIKEKDKDAVQELVSNYLRLVINIAGEFRDSGIEFIELVQIGNEALIKAAWNFDYTRNVRFSTYATSCIRSFISSYMDSYRVGAYINRYLHMKYRKFYKVYNSFDENDKDRLKKTVEILNISLNEGEKILLESSGVLSLNNRIDMESEDEMINLLQDDDNFEEQLINTILVEEIFNSDYLSEREKRVLRLKYGYETGKSLLGIEVADKMDLEPANVSRIEKRAIRKIRRRIRVQEDLKK